MNVSPCSSGTSALELSFRGLGLGNDYEVIVPANTFIATAEAVALAGRRCRWRSRTDLEGRAVFVPRENARGTKTIQTHRVRVYA